MKNKKTAKILTLVLTFIVVGMVGVGYVSFKMINAQGQELSKLQAERDAKNDIITKRLQLSKNLNSRKELSATLLTALPPDDQQTSLLSRVHDYALESGFDVSNIGISSAANPGSTAKVDPSCPLNASKVANNQDVCESLVAIQPSSRVLYAQVQDFLRKVEQSPHIMEVYETTLNGEGNSELVTFSAIVKIFTRTK